MQFTRRHARRSFSRATWALAATAAILLTACSGDAEPADDAQDAQAAESSETAEDASEPEGAEGDGPLAGATIDWLIPYDPGGGFDTYARLIAPYLEEELGAQQVVPVNKPGAGGLLAINTLYNTAEPDGRTIAIMNGGASAGAVIAGSENVQFEFDELTMIGLAASDPNMVVTSPDSDFQTWEDVLEADREIRFASTGVTSADYIAPSVLTAAFGIETDIITGFKGSSESELSVIRGETDMMTGGISSRAASLEAGETVPLVYMGPERHPDYPDTPTVFEFVDDGTEAQQILEADVSRSLITRIVVAPPDVDEAIASELQNAFKRALENPELVEKAEAAGRPLDYASPSELEDRLEAVLNAPEPYQQLLRESLS